jgi:hypothetical protein
MRLVRKNTNLWQALTMSAIVLLGELHTFWEHSSTYGKWILIYPWQHPIHIQNYIYENASMVNWVLFSTFAWRIGKSPTPFSFWLLGLFIVWKSVNIPFYWYNYRTFGYGWVYIGLIAIGIITYPYPKKRR